MHTRTFSKIQKEANITIFLSSVRKEKKLNS